MNSKYQILKSYCWSRTCFKNLSICFKKLANKSSGTYSLSKPPTQCVLCSAVPWMSRETLARPSLRSGERRSQQQDGLARKWIGRCRALRGRGARSAQGVLGEDSGDSWDLPADKCGRGWSLVENAAPLHVQRLRGGEKVVCLVGGGHLAWTAPACTARLWVALLVTLKHHRKRASRFLYERIRSLIDQNISCVSI